MSYPHFVLDLIELYCMGQCCEWSFNRIEPLLLTDFLCLLEIDFKTVNMITIGGRVSAL